MRKIVNFGILGCSKVATEKVIPAVKNASNVNISALASRQKQKAEYHCQKLGIKNSYGSYEELLEDPLIDAVYISLPNSLHCEWAFKASQNGKHILCEKPAGTNPDEVKLVLEECRENNVLFMEGFMYRFHPQHQMVKKHISDGTIGDVKLVKSSFSFPLSARHSKIRLSKSLGGGCLLDIGCYCVDISRWIFESEPLSVFSHAVISKEYGVDTSFVGFLSFPGGKEAVFDCSFEMCRRNSYEVIGSKGKIEVPTAFTPASQTQITIHNEKSCFTENFQPISQYLEEFTWFSQSILELTDFKGIPQDALCNAQVVYTLKSSLQELKRINI